MKKQLLDAFWPKIEELLLDGLNTLSKDQIETAKPEDLKELFLQEVGPNLFETITTSLPENAFGQIFDLIREGMLSEGNFGGLFNFLVSLNIEKSILLIILNLCKKKVIKIPYDNSRTIKLIQEQLIKEQEETVRVTNQLDYVIKREKEITDEEREEYLDDRSKLIENLNQYLNQSSKEYQEKLDKLNQYHIPEKKVSNARSILGNVSEIGIRLKMLEGIPNLKQEAIDEGLIVIDEEEGQVIWKF